jgi:hypothetical protein
LRKLRDTNQFEGVELSKERVFEHAKRSALQEVISAISKRFSEFCDDTSSDHGVVTATRIADLKAWPMSWDSLKGTYMHCSVCKKITV